MEYTNMYYCWIYEWGVYVAERARLVACRRGYGGVVLGKGRCKDLLESRGRVHVKGRGGVEKYC